MFSTSLCLCCLSSTMNQTAARAFTLPSSLRAFSVALQTLSSPCTVTLPVPHILSVPSSLRTPAHPSSSLVPWSQHTLYTVLPPTRFVS
ncbi:hypothetical protein BC835DRAFT_1393539 [Cytidiella melzeri]|nr:hypothetical protein BC835DRAFT_1393539 [Cytidiella melzeri]